MVHPRPDLVLRPAARVLVLAAIGCALLAPRTPAQCRVAKLLADDRQAHDYFGVAFEVAWPRIVVTAPGVDGTHDNQGAAYVFDWAGTGWQQTARLVSDDPHALDSFGSSLAMLRDRLVVGVPYDNRQGVDDAGTAFVFELVGGAWVQAAKIQPPIEPEATRDRFAKCIALDGRTAVFGVPGYFHSAGKYGALYVYQYDGTLWNRTAVIEPSGTDPDGFGETVDLQGDTIVAGAPNEPSSGSGWADGVAYVFERQAAGWAEVARLSASDFLFGASFGADIALDGDVLAIGAPGAGPIPDQGAVYVFERSGSGTWGPHETFKIVASDGKALDRFGMYVDLAGTRLAACAPLDPDGPGGSVYLFERSATGWEETAKLLRDPLSNGTSNEVALAGDLVLVGTQWEDDCEQDFGSCDTGAVFIRHPFPVGTPYCFGDTCPCGNDEISAGCENSTGEGALLEACGSTSVALDDLVLSAIGVPPNHLGLFYMGGGTVDVPFGDGLRCVGAGGVGMYRYVPASNSGSSGTLTLGPGIIARSQQFGSGAIDAGETWYFQTWYRDTMGPPCGTFINLSNGMALSFTP